MEWTAPKRAASPPSPPLLWDWGGDHAGATGSGSGSSGDAPARRGGREREAKRARADDGEVRCQVEGCGLDLSRVKEYHRKHRVCEAHTKSPRVVVAGQERRFCQQCSRSVAVVFSLACFLLPPPMGHGLCFRLLCAAASVVLPMGPRFCAAIIA
jgi:hypothetical protein